MADEDAKDIELIDDLAEEIYHLDGGENLLHIAEKYTQATYNAYARAALRAFRKRPDLAFPSCADCGWFERSPWPTEEGPAWGECLLAKFYDGDDEDMEEPERPNRRMYSYDGSAYKAGLNVRSDFGCADFAPKGDFDD